jgi:hypothetical protein
MPVLASLTSQNTQLCTHNQRKPPFFMRVLSVTVLMRDAASLHSALNVLRGALGFQTAWSPTHNNLNGSMSAGVVPSTGGPVIELLTTSPSLHVTWDDRKGRPPVRALLASVNLGSQQGGVSASPGLSISTLVQRVAIASRVRSVLESMGLASRGGVEVGGPAIVIDGSYDFSHNSTGTVPLLEIGGSGNGNGNGGELKEIVIGAEGQFLNAALDIAHTLVQNQTAARDKLASCAWRLSLCGTTLRLLPSRYSALVLSAPKGEKLTEIKMRLDNSGVGGTIYGDRHGTADSGQILVTCDELAGLDLRYCVHMGARPFFNEAREELTDFLDPNLNPEHGSDAANTKMNCRSIVSMDLVSTIKLRLLGRVS